VRNAIGTLLMLGLATAGTASASTNHVRNGLFGTGTDPWIIYSDVGMQYGWTNLVGHAALGSFSVGTNAAAQRDKVVLEQCVGVVGGAVYSFGGWFSYASGFGTAARGRFDVHWYPGTACDGMEVPPIASTDTSSTTAGLADQWQNLTATPTAPPTAASALVHAVFLTDSANTASGYFDDISLTGGISGDVDGNGTRDIADVFALINFLFANGPLPAGPADVDSSDGVDVADVFYLINFLFAGGPAPL
jgi:hypothetical protein